MGVEVVVAYGGKKQKFEYSHIRTPIIGVSRRAEFETEWMIRALATAMASSSRAGLSSATTTTTTTASDNNITNSATKS